MLRLVETAEVLLCDEITVDLDILGRLDLLKFFEEECEERGATIIYATHIFDGMHDWMTHLAFISNGELKYGQGGRKEDIEEIKGIDHLLSTIEDWLRVDRDETKARNYSKVRKNVSTRTRISGAGKCHTTDVKVNLLETF